MSTSCGHKEEDDEVIKHIGHLATLFSDTMEQLDMRTETVIENEAVGHSYPVQVLDAANIN